MNITNFVKETIFFSAVALTLALALARNWSTQESLNLLKTFSCDDRVLIESFMHHRAQWRVDGLKFRKLFVTSSNSALTTLLSSIASFIRYYFLLCSSRNETVQTDVWRSQFPQENEFAEDIQFMNSYLDLNYLCIKKFLHLRFRKKILWSHIDFATILSSSGC